MPLILETLLSWRGGASKRPLSERLSLLEGLLEELEAWDNPQTFARRYLRRYLTAPPAPFHTELYGLMGSDDRNKREAVAAPRGHGKSVLMSLVFPLWALATRRRRFVVILSSTSTIAEGFLGSIVKELEENELLRQDFGDLVGREKWTDREILTSTGIRVVARGTDSSLRGMRSFESRPDLIICDDLEDEDGVQNPLERQKLESWFYGSVMNLPGPQGDVFVIGTVLHHDSLLGKLLRKWRGRRYQALSPDDSALWPDYYDADRLRRIRYGDGQKEGIGTLAFECEYQNNPISPEEQLIREEWVRYYRREDIEGQELLIVTALDPSLGSSGGDPSALVTVGQKDGRIYVLEADIARRSPRDTLESAIRNFQRWSVDSPSHFLCLAIETNAFQVVLKDMLEDMSRRLGLFIPVRAVRNFSDKAARISSLSPLVENGTILFLPAQSTPGGLIEQLIQFPRGAHDDGPDALEMAVRMLRRHGTPRIRFV